MPTCSPWTSLADVGSTCDVDYSPCIKNRPVLCRGRGDSSFGLVQPGLCKAGDELLEHVGHLDERTDRDELVDAVVAIAAGGKVGAGQTAER